MSETGCAVETVTSSAPYFAALSLLSIATAFTCVAVVVPGSARWTTTVGSGEQRQLAPQPGSSWWASTGESIDSVYAG